MFSTPPSVDADGMTKLARVLLLGACALFALPRVQAEDAPKFRTDADGPTLAKETDKNKPLWFQLVDGKFPPENSAHAISGELTEVDHLERRFHLRVDRNDSQDRGVWDLPVDATMLPYGSIYYHGSPAGLQDIPLGTHLHGLFYLKAPDDKTPLPPGAFGRVTPDGNFRRCFRLEDDFTYRMRQKQIWKIDAVDLTKKKLTATLQQDGAAVGKSQLFDLLASTLVLKEGGFGDLNSLLPGQSVLFNLTWVTLFGPGRILEISIDEPSRQRATAHQLERHRINIRERGLPGWVDAVDDDAQIVTITFFSNVDPKLFDDLTLINEEPMGWPLSKPEDKPKEPKGSIAVALPSLLTYDPINDRKGGNILEINKVEVAPGSSGVQIKVKCDMMLEGYRPRRIVRFYPATWKVDELPREEKYEGRE